jgi:hypothetical protein
MLNNIIEIGGLAATAINIIQSQRIHEDETSHAQKRHDESMNVAKIQHEKDLKIAKQTYLMAAFTSLEQHFQVYFVWIYSLNSIFFDNNPDLIVVYLEFFALPAT